MSPQEELQAFVDGEAARYTAAGYPRCVLIARRDGLEARAQVGPALIHFESELGLADEQEPTTGREGAE